MLRIADLNPFKNILNLVPYVTPLKEVAAHFAGWDGDQCAPSRILYKWSHTSYTCLPGQAGRWIFHLEQLPKLGSSAKVDVL